MNNTLNATHSSAQNQALYDQFRLVLSCVIVVMIIFLIFFVYNLIKCYLPKWLDKRKQAVQTEQPKKQRTNYAQVELDEV
jgi:uncharacterized membrane protein (DUF485 family)